jgi:hypothetical protein
MEQEEAMSDKRFSTAELIAYVQRWKNCCASPYIDDESEADVQKCIDIERAIIARLRAAEVLASAAHVLVVGLAELRWAIADYEGVA